MLYNAQVKDYANIQLIVGGAGKLNILSILVILLILLIIHFAVFNFVLVN